MVDTLDSCFDDDINNDVNSLYVEIIDKNRTRMHDLWPKVFEERKTRNPLELCSRQRWETTQANHNFECDYKLCFTLIFFIRKIQKQLYAITEVHWNSRLQMVMHSLKGNSCTKIYLWSWSKWFLNIKAYGPLRSHLVQPKDALERTK